MNSQACLFLSTIIIGAFIGFIYDCFRIFRKIIPHSHFFIQLEDGIFWIMVILTMFLFMLHENFGEIRFFSIIGAFLGMLLYFLTVSKLVILVSSTVIAFLKKALCLFLTILFTPFRLLYLLFRKPVEKTGRFFRSKTKKILHLSKVCVRIKGKRMKQAFHIMRKKQ